MISKQSETTRSKGNANLKVVVRLRPPNEAEDNQKYRTVTHAISNHMLVFDPKVQAVPGIMQAKPRNLTSHRFKDLKYAFDHVFGPGATNREVFEHATKGVVSGVLNGYNCSVFAYGATGAGKTHTMLGSECEPGVIYLTMMDLYRQIEEQENDKTFDVAVSYSEVYNEQVRDLLVPRGSLPIREDKTVGVIIAGLSLHKPKTAEELLHMLHFGNKNRTQHPTDANAESSRSHAVFQVFVNQRNKLASMNSEMVMAKMCLVDLAGSERAHCTTNCGARFREGANINRSLLALGNVINALADNRPGRAKGKEPSDTSDTELSEIKAQLASLMQLVPMVHEIKKAYDESMTLVDEDVSGCGENEDANETEDNEPCDMAYFDNVAGISTEKEYNVQPKIATGVEKILSEGLSKETVDNLYKKYQRPTNCTRLAVLPCNPEVFKHASTKAKMRDSSLQNTQKVLIKGVCAIKKVSY
ncbi:kinesin-like protein [Elysia marginata]|uniref:Kinesin-like protein n=1 Tax=Elysia marginata TaxID=1093978 RepID=A0AAV4I708_9GAST|nr:kinesin-like protein [Elysia marginata]